MSTIDSRIVTMKFDNASFQRGVSTTLGALGKLKTSLTSLSGSSKGLNDVNAAAGRFSLGTMASQVQGVSGKFLALSTVAITALSNITNRAVNAGLGLAKSLTLAPIMDGFREYETNMNSIQTVLANTKDQGSNLKDVNKALASLNAYSDKTIYNFSEMAKNIGTFTAAGVDLQTSVDSIKGIANLAAISGSNSEQASTAMYQLSQAISAGKVGLQDWNSVVNAGMGGAVFQKALARTAVAMGVIDDKQVTTTGSMKKLTIAGESFRESISAKPGHNSWLTSDVLVNTLKQFSGDMTDAELKAMGFKDAQIQAVRSMGKMGVEAATKVKTMTQLIGTLREGVGSGWAKTWSIVFGNFKEARTTFTNISNVLGGMIGRSADARNKILGDWKKLGGRTALIKAISNTFYALMAVLKPIRQAFRDIFPPMTGKRLYDLTIILRNFTEGLMINKGTAEDLRRTFRGVFAILGIGWEILKGVVHYFAALVPLLLGGGDSALEFTGSISDLLVKFHDWLMVGDKIKTFFDTVIAGRAKLMEPLIAFVGKLVEAFAALITSGPDAFMDKLHEAFTSVIPVIDAVRATMQEFVDKFHEGFNSLGPVAQTVRAQVQRIVDTVKRVIGGLDLNLGSLFDMGDSVSVAEAGVKGVGAALGSTVGVADRVRDSWSSVVNVFKRVGQFLAPIWGSIKEIFSGLKDRITGYVKNLGFDEGLSLVNTGFFIAFYLMLRSFIRNMKGLVESMKGTFDNISGVLEQVTANLKTMQADIRADIILKIAGALALLSVAILVLSKIDSKKLGIALGAVAIMLTQLVVAMRMLERNADITGSAQVMLLSVALTALSIALLAMAGALAIIGQMKIKTIFKGLTAVSAILALVVTVTTLLSRSGGAGQLLVAAGAILILGAALTAFAGALKLYSAMDTGTLLEGGLKVAAALTAIALTMGMMPPNMLGAAAAIFIVANALVVMAGALKLLGNLSAGEMIKSLLILVVALPLLAGAMILMSGTLSGSAAMLVMSAALVVLAAALKALGSLDLMTIGIALVAIAGVFVVLGLAAVILAPVVPVLFALAGAIGLLGLAVLAIGGGLLMFSAGLAALAATGAAGVAVLVAAVISIAEIIPLIMHQFGLGVIAFAEVIAKSGPPLIRAFTTVLLSLIAAVVKVTPPLAAALTLMMHHALRVLRDVIPDLVQTGLDILIAFLSGIRDNIGKIVTVATSIVVKFLNSLARNQPRVVQAGVHLIISFINGITQAINDNSERLGRAGGNLAVAIANGMIRGLGAAAGQVARAAAGMAGNALNAAMERLGIHSPSREFAKVGGYSALGLAEGLSDHATVVARAGSGMAQTALDVITATMSRIPEAISSNVDMSPVITPVLDLTQMANDASKIGTMLDTQPLTAGVSYDQAASISAERQAAQDAAAQDTSSTQPNVTEIKLEQNNYSPKPLDPIELYRNTKSQLSLAKEALNA